MRPTHILALPALALMLSAPVLPAQTATEDTKADRHALKHAHDAEKAQAKADKKQAKALGSHEQKKADKAQDKADRKAGEIAPN